MILEICCVIVLIAVLCLIAIIFAKLWEKYMETGNKGFVQTPKPNYPMPINNHPLGHKNMVIEHNPPRGNKPKPKLGYQGWKKHAETTEIGGRL